MYGSYMAMPVSYQGFLRIQPYQFSSMPILVYPPQPGFINLHSSCSEALICTDPQIISQQTDPVIPNSNTSPERGNNGAADKKTTTKRTKKKIKSVKHSAEKKDPEQPKSRVWKNSLLSFTCNKILKYIIDTSQTLPIVKVILQRHHIIHKKAVDDFYGYANRTIHKIINKISIQKIRELWLGNGGSHRLDPNLVKIYHQILRVLSKRYLDKISVSYILSSKKSKKFQWFYHLRMRRWLIEKLRDPEEFINYDDF